MKKIIFALLILICFSFKSPMASTWNGTASNELVSGAALSNGATVTGLWTVTGTPPATKMMTKADLITYTNIPTSNSPLSGYANNQCVTKQAISGVF